MTPERCNPHPQIPINLTGALTLECKDSTRQRPVCINYFTDEHLSRWDGKEVGVKPMGWELGAAELKEMEREDRETQKETSRERRTGKGEKQRAEAVVDPNRIPHPPTVMLNET